MISEGQLNRSFTKPASPFFIIGPAADVSGAAFVVENESTVRVQAEMDIVVIEIRRSQIGIDANNRVLTAVLAGVGGENRYVETGRNRSEEFPQFMFDNGFHFESSCCEGTNLVRRSA